jgi:hypothetical protein
MQRLLCKGRGRGNTDDVEAGKRKKIASILKLDGVAPSRAYGKGKGEAEEDKPKAEPRLSHSFDDVIVWYVVEPSVWGSSREEIVG